MFDEQSIILIDTSGDKALVALVRDGEVVGERWWENGPGVGRVVLENIDILLDEQKLKLANIDRIAVRVGPGRRYSSLRSGVVAGSLLAQATGKELVEIRGEGIKEMISEAQTAEPTQVAVPVYEKSSSFRGA